MTSPHREADQFMPHRTIVDFALIFKNDTLTEDPTHHLFEVVSTTKSLDGMPVLPKTLTVKGICLHWLSAIQSL